MNRETRAVLAKKYAQAFMNIYGNQLNDEHYQNIPLLTSFFYEHRSALSFLTIPHIPLKKKMDAIASLLAQFSLPHICMKIFVLIMSHKRGQLLPQIFEYIYEFYQKKHTIVQCIISSSHHLSQDMQSSVVEFLSRQTGMKIIYTYVVDPSLIAGIRAQGKTFVWECSVKQKLDALLHAFIISY